MNFRIILFFFSILFISFSAYADNTVGLDKKTDQILVYVKDANNIGAFEIELNYHPTNFQINEIKTGEFLNTSKRKFTLIGPVSKEPGKANFGFFSMGGLDEKGIMGSGIIAVIHCHGDITSAKIRKLKVSDPKGNRKYARYE